MQSLKVLSGLKQLGFPVFRTADAMALFGMKGDTANKVLTRLFEEGLIKKILRGLWSFPEVDLNVLPEYITAPHPSYISLQSALFFHGMISQIPQITYAVSTARTKRYQTPLGVISIHHISPSFFLGYQPYGPHHIKLASPEKALADLFYLSPAKSRLFSSLPEWEAPQGFKRHLVLEFIQKISDEKRRGLVIQKWKKMF